ncbi:Na+/H+ antiporter [Chitinophaga parva]|uniref:Na+/H+ antiporter n=1 Tax=Chitinophaga parva TaxID=2169414 RepID=A0A2T7BQC7_9BACT|nr:Na+/H+ antiporter [Chitinophaga parva]PUZ29875.1 Na+/H+ antiporter [Chitinophaga parva]
MQQFDAVILSLVVLVALSTLEGKVKFPFPILLVITGVFLGFIPQFPILMLDPDVVFLIFLPPLLFDAASRTSWHDFRKDILPISTLAIALVFFTTVILALTAHYFIPEFTWPLAFLLGAIVSPPDAVAATGITKGLGLNKRVVTIIEGESLVNDASALIGYRFALIAVNTGSFVLWQAGLQFILLVAGGILCGIATGYILVWMHKKITHNSITSTSLTLLTPFVSYILAERLHVSGVLAVVCTGLFIAWRSPKIFSYQTRIRSKSVWDTLIYILNGFIFLLIGQQLPDTLKELEAYSLLVLLAYGLLISVMVIVVRIMWVFATAFSYKLIWEDVKTGASMETQDESATTWKNVLIVAWTGTRGIVSMATALALPITLMGGAHLPHRSLILFLTSVVIFVTLVIQGMSLPLMIRILGIKPNLQSDNEEKELQKFVLQSMLYFIEHEFPIPLEESIKRQIKAAYEETLSQLQRKTREGKITQSTNLDEEPWLTVPVAPVLLAQLEISKFRRKLLLKLHKDSSYNYQSIRKLEQQLDRDDLNLNDDLKRDDE